MTEITNHLRRLRAWAEEVWLLVRYALMNWKLAFDGWIDRLFSHRALRRDEPFARNFKSDADAIEEASVPMSTHAALYVVLSLLLIAVVWSLFGSVDRIVVAPGKITTPTHLIVMQPFTTSRILKIHVSPGDHVLKGQTLASFDPALAEADVVALQYKVTNLTAEISRLNAELADKTFAAGKTDLPARKTQADIFAQEMSEFAAENIVRDSRVGAIDSQLDADKETIADLRQQLKMAQKVVRIRQRLLDLNAGAPLDVMVAQSSKIEFEIHLKNAIGEVNRLSQQRAEIQAERQSFLEKWHSDHNEQLVQAQQNLDDARESLNKARKLHEFTEMKSPANAVVLEIADRSTGSVLREAETLMSLVQDGAKLYVEANVSSRDIGYLKVGDSVQVKLEAYPFQRYGTLRGTLDVIGADSVPIKQDDHSNLVYHAQIRLMDDPRQLAKRGIIIRPGLVANAEIKTGRRSIASYVLNPILRTTDESLREP